jgi:hypothetical protein
MNTIDHLNSFASISETADISNSVNEAIEKASLTDEFLTRQNQQLKSTAAEMIAGIGAKRGKELKDEVDEADALRDSLFIALTQFVKAHITWNNARTSSAANTIMSIIKSHGNSIVRQSYEKESALLDSLLGEFEKPPILSALKLLNLSELAGELKAAQTQFKTLYQQSALLESGKAGVIAPSSISKDAVINLNLITDYLNVMYKANPEVYGKLASNIAELVNSLNGKIRTRRTIQKTEALKTATAKAN